MLSKIVPLALLIGACTVQAAEFSQSFGEWKVSVTKTDFDKKAEITHPLYDRSTGKKLDAEFELHISGSSRDHLFTIVSIHAYPQVDPTFPECDLDYLRYKIDSKPAVFFPSDSGSCETLLLKKEQVDLFKAGKELLLPRIAGLQETKVDLIDFDKAWGYAEKLIRY